MQNTIGSGAMSGLILQFGRVLSNSVVFATEWGECEVYWHPVTGKVLPDPKTFGQKMIPLTNAKASIAVLCLERAGFVVTYKDGWFRIYWGDKCTNMKDVALEGISGGFNILTSPLAYARVRGATVHGAQYVLALMKDLIISEAVERMEGGIRKWLKKGGGAVDARVPSYMEPLLYEHKVTAPLTKEIDTLVLVEIRKHFRVKPTTHHQTVRVFSRRVHFTTAA